MTQNVSRDELPDSCDYWPVVPGDSMPAQLVLGKNDCPEYLRFFCVRVAGHELPHVADTLGDRVVAVWDDKWYADVLGVNAVINEVPQ